MKKNLHTILFIRDSMKKYNPSLKYISYKLKLSLKTFLFLIIFSRPVTGFSQASASLNYGTRTGTLRATYSWMDCSSGTSTIAGDNLQASINWPFNFNFYDNSYTTANSLSVSTNDFIRLDGTVDTDSNTARSFDLTADATNPGQIIVLAVYDNYVGNTIDSWCRYLVTWISNMLSVESLDADGTLKVNYPTLKAAIDKVNNGTHEGYITLKIQGSIIESSSVIPNASSNRKASYTSEKIYPTSTSLSISGNLTAPLIYLNALFKVLVGCVSVKIEAVEIINSLIEKWFVRICLY